MALIRELAERMATVRRETREATIRECAEVASEYARAAGALQMLSATRAKFAAETVAENILDLLTPPSAPAEPEEDRNMFPHRDICPACGFAECRCVAAELDDTYPTLDPVTTAPRPRKQIDATRGPRRPAEPKCKVCGHGPNAEHHWLMPAAISDGHDFEPEEPGHGGWIHRAAKLALDLACERERAEKAEAQAKECNRLRDQANDNYAETIEQREVMRVRAELAEQRLAELVRDIRHWWTTGSLESKNADEALAEVLAKYEEPGT